MTDDWVSVFMEVPPEVAQDVLALLRDKHGMREIDWCELQRPDYARASYGPCERRTSSGYTVDPFTS